ncbi:uncharacterized protein LOC122804449 isoform X1 [Protopterus annectens]|uniref:uncharacterized protein LOC122804449 isoform X1 n=1 Tax=Protopterus annectens TaxID=7888 RepID=UPI001CFABE40|nr:uncharacterized protein LOC122804449 isoform X1 [Protopterus annectens]
MRHVKSFVCQELFPESDTVEETRRRFFPTRKDISNLLLKSRYEGHNSKLDQENILHLVQNWQKQTPNCSIFCRANSVSEANSVQQNFLFCYQTDWQKKLLKKYGNQITLLDATYRTTRYALPLFFLCVRTNVCYTVVAAFVTQLETSMCILEPLNILKQWNDEWKPSCFMVDFCLEEINALSNCFPDASIMLCDFHREKAWTEWVAKKDHGVHNFRKNILGMLRSIAHAATTEDLHTALTALKKSQCWKTGEAFRQWFSTKWLPAIKMWAHVYRSGTEHIGVNTNNGLERQYETLKYSYLDGYKNCTLSELLTVLHSTFFPNAYKK